VQPSRHSDPRSNSLGSFKSLCQLRPWDVLYIARRKIRCLKRDDAQKLLECLKTARTLTDVFFVGGTCAFVPSPIPDEDWDIIMEELTDS
jgi:hypothetical protein